MDNLFLSDDLNSENEIFRLINASKYDKARKLIESMENVNLDYVFSMLERDEYNFNKYKMHIYNRLKETNLNISSLCGLGEYYFQIGEHDKAIKIFEYLTTSSYFRNYVLEKLAHVSMYEGDYSNAQKYFDKIRYSGTDPEELKKYKTLELYIKYYLGKLKKSDIEVFESYNYLFKRLMNHSDKIILDHIKKHCGEANAYLGSYFYEDLDMLKLLTISQESIQKMNAIHSGFADKYRFKLSYPIGISDGNSTNDICVVTVLGTKDIITMYPISLSSEFDEEGISTSKELKLNRLKGAISNDKQR